MRLHHVQVCMPRGQEEDARRFYRDALGMNEAQKPPSLADRGGCWFRSFDGSAVVAEIHVGVDDAFVPANKAHPALLLESVGELEKTSRRIVDAGFDVSWEERDTFEGYVRFHTRDGFGNRVEILAVAEVSR